MLEWGLFGAGALLLWAALTGRSPAGVIQAVLTGKQIPVGTTLGTTLVHGTGKLDPSFDAGRQRVAEVALQQLGKPYRWGAEGPDAFDCSGLTQYAYHVALGIELPRTAAMQASWNRTMDTNNPHNGDLVFLGVPAYHVGIWYNGQYINAPDVGQVVKVSPIPRNAYTRFVTDPLGGH